MDGRGDEIAGKMKKTEAEKQENQKRPRWSSGRVPQSRLAPHPSTSIHQPLQQQQQRRTPALTVIDPSLFDGALQVV